jgi:F420-dependent oxidoreductase-like protein
MGTDGLPGPTDAWTTLAGLARETTRLRLGTLVSSATFRLPGVLAITVANVDLMSEGRVELGIGSGWYDDEHLAYGIPFPSLGERFARLEEQLAIVTGLWSAPPGERFSFEGAHYRLRESPALPKPAQAGGPPVIIGGWGARRTPRLAATFASEYNVPFAPPRDYGPQNDKATAACEQTGRDPSTLTRSVAVTVCCGADEAEFERRAAGIGQAPSTLRANQAGGTPAEVVERLHEYRDAGAERVYLQVLDMTDLDHLRLLAAEVAPHC